MSDTQPLSFPCDVLVTMTQEDITHGVRGYCGACPVARAVSRAVGLPAGAADDSIRVFLSHDWTEWFSAVAVAVTPRFVARFILAFDSSRPGDDSPRFGVPTILAPFTLHFDPFAPSEADNG